MSNAPVSLAPRLLQFLEVLPFRLKARAPVLIACSGGPDSVALALAAAEAAERRSFRPVLVHVNHGLRGRASDGDQLFVGRLGKNLGLTVRTARIRLERHKGNLEERARVKRYAALLRIARMAGSPLILTAHNLDDQAETVILNLSRGAGVRGAGAMSPARQMEPGTWIGRPFLGSTRSEILAYLKSKRGSFRKDASNNRTHHVRNWVRLRLLPEWESKFPSVKEALARFADVSREAAEVLFSAGETAAREAVHRRGKLKVIDNLKLSYFSEGLQREVLRRAIGSDLLTFSALERLRSWMCHPPTGGRLFELKKGVFIERLSRSQGHESPSLFAIRKRKGGPLRRDQNTRKRRKT